MRRLCLLTFTLILVLIGTSSLVNAVPALRIFNDGRWRKYYSDRDVSDSKIAKELEDLRDNSLPGLVDEKFKTQFEVVYAKYGDKLIPYLVKMSGDRGLYLHPTVLLMNRKLDNYKYIFVNTLFRIGFSSPSDYVELKKIMFDSLLGQQIRDKIVDGEYGLTAQEITEIFKADWTHYIGNAKMLTVIKKLPPQEALIPLAYMSDEILGLGEFKDVNAVKNLADDKTTDYLGSIVELIGNTASNDALILLEKHSQIVQNGHRYGKNLKVAKSVDKLLPVYNTAIEKLKRDIKARTKGR